MRTFATSFVAIAIATTSFAAPAFAQDEAAADEGLGEIVVTAQRREENLQDVPLSVDVVSGDKLAAINSGGGDIRALAGRVPSLNIESSFGRTFPRFYIRGLGNTDFDLNASQPVSLVYDDVVLENPILKGFPVFDVARVEVLRGPQGTLFGRNTPAGIVKFESARPDSTSNYLKGSFGRFNSLALETGVGGQVSDSLSARVSGQYQRRSDWVDNIAEPGKNNLEGYSDIALRGQLQFAPTEDIKLRVAGQYRDFKGTARVFRANMFVPGSNDLSGVGGVGSDFERDKVWTDGINFQRLKLASISSTLEWDLGPATLTSVTAWWMGKYRSRGDIDGGFGAAFLPVSGPGFIPFPAQSRDDVPDLDQVTQEVRLSSNNDEGLKWQAGVFYFDEDLAIASYNYDNPQDTNESVTALQQQNSKAWGVFGSLTYPVSEQLSLTAGIRYNNDKRRLDVGRTGFFGAIGTGFARVKDDNLTWDLSATYEASDDINLYARVAKGYRAPSIQGRALFVFTTVQDAISTADSETILSFEGGVKANLGGRSRFNLSVFKYDLKDAQLTAVGGASNAAKLINADKVDGYGFEAEFETRPVDNLVLTAGLSYNRAKIDDPNAFITGCGGGCTVTDPVRPGSPGIYSIDGNQLPQAPKWSANWTAGYGIPVGTGSGEVYVFTDWAYRSKVNFFLYTSEEFNDDHMLEGGLRAGYRSDRIDIAAFVRNITNDVSAVGGIDFNNLTGFVNEPRIWGLELGLKF
ncbi:TonB-dependent receptor [Sphingorhabdus pulchriflava]|uniref:TonB-dependent receptor n=1 Tax=Sphingorhabdus pulchriflava TaxID=2292257 RepID=A0A371B6B8_9SPHN|nr:TonB-dependent receptor [Sphingorhabdus pulchriflava]RDV03057.1 TonB-dependent receptor [Sphingorhabdus pulchriflava]